MFSLFLESEETIKGLILQLEKTPDDKDLIGVIGDWFADNGFDGYPQMIQKLMALPWEINFGNIFNYRLPEEVVQFTTDFNLLQIDRNLKHWLKVVFIILSRKQFYDKTLRRVVQYAFSNHNHQLKTALEKLNSGTDYHAALEELYQLYGGDINESFWCQVIKAWRPMLF